MQSVLKEKLLISSLFGMNSCKVEIFWNKKLSSEITEISENNYLKEIQ